MKRWHIIATYLFVITTVLFLGLMARQSDRYDTLEREVQYLEAQQLEWIEENKRLIAVVAKYSAPNEIEKRALRQGLVKIIPENVLQIRIKR